MISVTRVCQNSEIKARIQNQWHANNKPTDNIHTTQGNSSLSQDNHWRLFHKLGRSISYYGILMRTNYNEMIIDTFQLFSFNKSFNKKLETICNDTWQQIVLHLALKLSKTATPWCVMRVPSFPPSRSPLTGEQFAEAFCCCLHINTWQNPKNGAALVSALAGFYCV